MNCEHVVALKRRTACQERVQYAAQAVHVRRRRQFPFAAARLLGRHVTGRTDNHPGLGQAGVSAEVPRWRNYLQYTAGALIWLVAGKSYQPFTADEGISSANHGSITRSCK